MMPQKPSAWIMLGFTLFLLVAWWAGWLTGWLDSELDTDVQDVPSSTQIQPSTLTSVTAPTVKTVTHAKQPVVSTSAATPTVAEAYAASVAYPPYSQPYQAAFLPADDQQYHAQAIEQTDGSAWRLALQRYRHYRPDALDVSLTVDNLAASAILNQLRYEVRSMDDDRLLQSGDVLAQPSTSATVPTSNAAADPAAVSATSADMAGHASAGNRHQLQWSLALSPDNDWPTELSLKVFSDSEHSVRAAFEYVIAVASVEHVDSARTDDHQLKIPVTLAVKQAGLYRIQALLQDRHGQSLALLSHEQSFTTGRQSFELAVHGSVLPKADTELQLRHIRLQLASMHPAEMTRFGRANDEVFALGRFARSDVRQEQYQPTDEEQARMAFLQQLQQGQ